MKFFKNKKAFNDITIVAGILSIFLITATLIPLISADLGSAADTFDTDAYEQGVKTEAENIGSLSAFTILLNVMKLAFFDFGNTLNLPFWLDIVFTILAVILILTVARNVWIGGGG